MYKNVKYQNIRKLKQNLFIWRINEVNFVAENNRY